ncbi:MAG: helix-turn-helix transcriptional regulator [Sphingorhabdus sp.]|nr:helix-turn-helix transcriptional regulator [Sphingorhabdus sp.]
MENDEPRATLERLIAETGDDYSSLSKLVGRNAAYIQQYIKRGTPKRLGERERAILARYFGVDETLLGAPDKDERSGDARTSGLRMIPKLRIDASAGPGALVGDDEGIGQIGFDEKWLKNMGCQPSHLSLISVLGDSMAPTLIDGDDIMVDSSAANGPLRDGIHVIRIDDTLMVKRLAKGPGGRISILSDNPAYPDWRDIDGAGITVIGRVVWAGRRL